MKMVAVIGLIAAISLAPAAMAQVTLHDIRAVKDVAAVDIAKIASADKTWDIISVRPTIGSGEAQLMNAFIDADTGEIVTRGPVSISIVYWGDWKLLHRFAKEEPENSSGRFRWAQGVHEERRRSWVERSYPSYDPFTEGGVVLVNPSAQDQVTTPWHAVHLLLEDTATELVEAIDGSKAASQDTILDEEQRWNQLFTQLSNNMFVASGRLKYELQKGLKDGETDVVEIAKEGRGWSLAVSAAVIADEEALEAAKRTELLLKLANAAPAEQRQYVFVGLVASEFPRPEILPILIQDSSSDLIVNEQNVESLPERVQQWYRSIVAGNTSNASAAETVGE